MVKSKLETHLITTIGYGTPKGQKMIRLLN